MGASGSSSRSPKRSISLEPVGKRKLKKDTGKQQVSRKRHLRCSKNRPVLQLQVKPTTLERVRHRVGSTGSYSKNNYTSFSRDSAIFNHVPTRLRTLSTSSRSSDHAHHKRTFSTTSRDSGVLLQVHDDGSGALVTTHQDGGHGGHTPQAEFSQLCECMYGQVDVQMKEGDRLEAWHMGEGHVERRNSEGCGDVGTHKADIIYCHGRHGCAHHGLCPSQLILHPPSFLLKEGGVKRCVQYSQRVSENRSASPGYSRHEPLLCSISRVDPTGSCDLTGTMKKSKSTSDLLNRRVGGDVGNHTPQGRTGLTMSRSSIDGWDYADGEEAASEWTLGESIMRALSKRDLLVIDIDNPQTKSEFEIIEAWPRLKDELKRQHMSQSTGNIATSGHAY